MNIETQVNASMAAELMDLKNHHPDKDRLMNGVNMEAMQVFLSANAWRLTPATLASKVSQGDWVPAHHLLYISAKIAAALEKGNARLIVSMPPRHGKSELCSVWLPVWILDRWPTKKVMALSYGADLAEEFGQRVRDIIQADEDPDEGAHILNPKCYIRKDSARVNRFLTISGGGMRSVGLGGAVYGRGADVLLLDDYYKNLEEASSETKRQSVLQWFATVAMSRIQKNGSAIIVATRWGTEDLSAQMLALTGSKWTEINLPAFANENDVLGRQPGEALWPEFYDEERLNELKQTMGTFLFSAIYQQAPKKTASELFNRDWVIKEKYPPPRELLRRLRSWDMAGTESKGDWTAGYELAVDPATNHFWILGRKRVQFSPGRVEELVKQTAEDDGYDTQILIEQEPGSSGKTVIEHYLGTVLSGYAAHSVRHTGDKFIRAQPFFAACEFGRVHIIEGDWNEAFLDQCTEFPECKNDDDVDSVAQGYNHFFQKVAMAGIWGRKQKQPANDDPSIPGSRIVNAKSNKLVLGATFGRRR